MDIKQEIPFPIPTEKILVGTGLLADLCNYTGNYDSCLVVCDENTKDLIDIKAEKLVLQSPKASLDEAHKIPQGYALYIALGSGTINDLVKYAAFRANKPYIAYATAASMNGYASGNASLLEHGHKRSFAAHPPKAIFMDLDIISNAPKKLTLAGIGDAICRPLVENDNLLANHLSGVKYHHSLFRMMQQHEEHIHADISALCKTLIFGGAAMYLAGSSVPASGAEHMLAHYMELMQPQEYNNAVHSLHGEQVAVCSVATARIQHDIIHSGKLPIKEFDEELIASHFAATGEAQHFIDETHAKYNSIIDMTPNFPHSHFLEIDAVSFEEKLKAIGLPTTPEEIGWKRDIFEHALNYASFTRNRVTFLDMIQTDRSE